MPRRDSTNFHNADPGIALQLRKIFCRGGGLLAGRLGLAGDHVCHRKMPRLGTFAGTAAKVGHLVNDVGRWQSGEAGVLRAPLAVGQVTITASVDIGLSTVGHDVGHREDRESVA